MKHDPTSYIEIRKTLQHIVDGTDSTYELDDCFSVSFPDPKLEAMRQRLWSLPDDFPPASKGSYCGQAGIEIIRGWIEELSHHIAV